MPGNIAATSTTSLVQESWPDPSSLCSSPQACEAEARGVRRPRGGRPRPQSSTVLALRRLRRSNRDERLQLQEGLLADTLRAVQPLARRAIGSLGRDDVVRARPLQQAMAVPLLRERVMRLSALYFAGLTTLLVFVGLYAVLNLGVTRRIPEIGLRMALGRRRMTFG